jgi:O-antigen ligase
MPEDNNEMRHLVITLIRIYAFCIPLEGIVLFSSGTFQRMLAAVIGFIWMAMLFLERRKQLRLPKCWIWIGLFGVWTIASLSWSKHVQSLSYASTIIQLILFSLVITDMLEQTKLTSVLRCYCAGAVVTAAAALLTNQAEGITGRLTLGEIGPAHLGAAIWPAALFLSYRAICSRRVISRSAIIIATGIVMVSVLLTGTRSVWIATVVAAFFLAIRERRVRWIAILLGACSIAIILFVPVFYQRGIVQSIESGGAGRLDIWKVGLLIATERPFFGVGIGNFAPAFTWDAIARPGSFIYAAAILPGRDAHNIFLQIAAELGLIGLVLFVVPLVVTTVNGLHGQATLLQRLIVAVLIGYLVEGLFLPILNRKYFWFFIALSMGVLKRNQIASHKRTYLKGSRDRMVKP